MADIKEQPYAHWLEGVLHNLVELEPSSIAILTINTGFIGSAYFNCDNAVRALFGQQLNEDSMIQFAATNRKYLRDLIKEDDDDS